MAASANDLFLEVGNPGSATTLGGAGYTIGDTSITVGTTTNWPTATGVVFGIDRIEEDANGNTVRVEGSYCIFVGVVTSATTIGSVSKIFGDDQNYDASATTRVYITVSTEHNRRLIEGILVSHNQDGTLKTDAVTTANITDNNVTTAKIADSSVTTAKIADAAVTAEKIAAGAISLGYAESTTTQSKGPNTETDLTGLSTTVTIPSGGRKVRVTVHLPFNESSATQVSTVKIYDGATQLSQVNYKSTSTDQFFATAQAIHTPTAGSHTYKATISHSVTGTVDYRGAATYPKFIHVELI